jgi:hypothetical protein
MRAAGLQSAIATTGFLKTQWQTNPDPQTN